MSYSCRSLGLFIPQLSILSKPHTRNWDILNLFVLKFFYQNTQIIILWSTFQQNTFQMMASPALNEKCWQALIIFLNASLSSIAPVTPIIQSISRSLFHYLSGGRLRSCDPCRCPPDVAEPVHVTPFSVFNLLVGGNRMYALVWMAKACWHTKL